jgi:hypothetical protein
VRDNGAAAVVASGINIERNGQNPNFIFTRADGKSLINISGVSRLGTNTHPLIEMSPAYSNATVRLWNNTVQAGTVNTNTFVTSDERDPVFTTWQPTLLTNNSITINGSPLTNGASIVVAGGEAVTYTNTNSGVLVWRTDVGSLRVSNSTYRTVDGTPERPYSTNSLND